MNNKALAAFLIAGFILGSAVSGLAAQPSTERDGRNRLAHLQVFERKFGSGFTSHLSTGGANMFHLAHVLSNRDMVSAIDTPQNQQAVSKFLARPAIRAASPPRQRGTGPVPINDSSLDYRFSRLAGFTQSETSSAWCGDSIVVGFNDSGANIRSVLDKVGGASFSGVAASNDRGQSFSGLAYLNPGSDPGTFLGGDPVLVCSDSRHFAYASLLSQATFDSQGNSLDASTGIALNTSSSGGFTWEAPIAVITKDANFHFLDKEWMAIDPRNAQNLYVTYTDFQAHGTDPGCDGGVVGISPGPDVNVELVSSKDSGASWSRPVVLERRCDLHIGENLSGTQVVVGSHGDVYVAYANVEQKTTEIHVRRSMDGGATFSPVVVAAQSTAASTVGFDNLQGNFRTNTFPSLAIDLHQGNLYLAFTDASRNQVPDLLGQVFSSDPFYSFGDVVMSVSQTAGTTWSPAVIVSPTPKNFGGLGRDQFMPGIGVDGAGNLAVCYSDRRNDPTNVAIDHFCSLSKDQGKSFRDIRETTSSWIPSHLTDVLISPSYMGDYDSVSSDISSGSSGFFNSFQIQTNSNPDVFGLQLNF